jgi:hypothetical protein
MAGDEEQMVPNPYKSELQRVKTTTETAVENTPDIDDPASTIGPGPAWSGPKAREVHDNEIDPYGQPIRSALANLVSDVEEKLSSMPDEVTESQATWMRNDLRWR